MTTTPKEVKLLGACVCVLSCIGCAIGLAIYYSSILTPGPLSVEPGTCIQQNPQRQGRATGLKFLDVGPPVKKWSYTPLQSLDSSSQVTNEPQVSMHYSPVISSKRNMIFIPSYGNRHDDNSYSLHALQMDTGNVIWTKQISGVVATGSVIVSKDTVLYSVYFESSSEYIDGTYLPSKLHAVSALTGDSLWTRNFDRNALEWDVSNPVVSNDGVAVYVQNEDYLYAIKMSDGSELWHTDKILNSRADSSPAISVDGQTVYIGANSQTFNDPENGLKAISARDGSVQWTWRPDNDRDEVVGIPSVSNDGTTVYVWVTSDEMEKTGIRAIDTSDGTLRWIYYVGIYPSYSWANIAGPSISEDDKTLFMNAEFELLALDANGTLKWEYRYNLNGDVSTSETESNALLSADGHTVYSRVGEVLMAIDSADGSLRWSFVGNERGSNAAGTPTVSADSSTIYISSGRGVLLAVETPLQLPLPCAITNGTIANAGPSCMCTSCDYSPGIFRDGCATKDHLCFAETTGLFCDTRLQQNGNNTSPCRQGPSCASLPVLPHADITSMLACNGTASGSACPLQCDEGYSLIGGNPPGSVACIGGKWNISLLKCDRHCEVLFEKSKRPSCQLANEGFCAQAALAILVGRVLGKDGSAVSVRSDCKGDCQTTKDIRGHTKSLLHINLSDMLVEIISFVMFLLLIVGGKGEDTRLISRQVACFAVIDVGLQIAALVTSVLASNAASPFFLARCMDTTTIYGLSNHETLTKLIEAVDTAKLLGSIEIMCALIGVVGAFYGAHKSRAEERDVCGLYIAFVGQLVNTILAIVEYIVFSVEADSKADSLFETSASNYTSLVTDHWCVDLVPTSEACLINHTATSLNQAGDVVVSGGTGLGLNEGVVWVALVAAMTLATQYTQPESIVVYLYTS